MSVRSWFVLILGTLIMPAAQTAVQSVAKLSDASYLPTDAQHGKTLAYESASMSMPTISAGLGAAAPSGYERLPNWKSQDCEGGNCLDIRVAAIDQRIGPNSDSEGMSVLDAALMALFAAGLVAYQLARKQRVLRQSSLSAASL